MGYSGDTILIWVVCEVLEAIPVLGTGKLDLKRVKDAALAEFST